MHVNTFTNTCVLDAGLQIRSQYWESLPPQTISCELIAWLVRKNRTGDLHCNTGPANKMCGGCQPLIKRAGGCRSAINLWKAFVPHEIAKAAVPHLNAKHGRRIRMKCESCRRIRRRIGSWCRRRVDFRFVKYSICDCESSICDIAATGVRTAVQTAAPRVLSDARPLGCDPAVVRIKICINANTPPPHHDTNHKRNGPGNQNAGNGAVIKLRYPASRGACGPRPL